MYKRIEILFYIIFCVCLLSACKDQEAKIEPLVIGDEQQIEQESIYVYVSGAVQSPGVYEMPKGSRVFEAVELAGGFCEDADPNSVNQAEILEDEMSIYVFTIAESRESAKQDDGKVNLNTAEKEELMTLPGVGESKADSILQYRQEHGKFHSIEDVMQISGIKEGLFEKIKAYIKV